MISGTVKKIFNKKEFFSKAVRQTYSVLFALLPVLQIIKVPFTDFGISTLLLGVTTLYVLYVLFMDKTALNKNVAGFSVLFIALYMIYRMLYLNNNVTNAIVMLVAFFHVIACAKGSVDMATVKKTLIIVAYLASAIVVIQTLLYYLFNKSVSFIPYTLLTDELYSQYVNAFFSSSFLRPSAFFLEPSHFTQYVVVGLAALLFGKSKGISYVGALFVSLGLILSTSGMGIALTFLIWLLWLIIKMTKLDWRTNLLTAGIIIVIGALLCLLLLQIPTIKLAVQRVFGEVDGYNAIWGRTLHWDKYITPLTGVELRLGKGISALPVGIYFTGLMETIYAYGLFGLFLLFVGLFLSFLSRGNFVKCVIFIYVGLFFVANTMTFIMTVFFMGFFISEEENQAEKVMANDGKIRILVYGLSGRILGGIETFALNFNSNMSENVIFDYAICGLECIHKETIEKKGGRVYHIAPQKRILKNLYTFKKLLLSLDGQTDIVYFNYSSLLYIEPVLLARSLGYKVIVHSHNNALHKKGFLFKALHAFNKWRLSFFKITRWSNSQNSSEFLFGKKPATLIYNAIDAERFKYSESVRNEERKQLNIPDGKRVIGFVGRVVYQKNPLFLLDIFKEIRSKDNNVLLLMVGTGDMLSEAKEKAEEIGISDNIIWAGTRGDIERLYNAMDLFLLPSLFEGLGIVLIEAQANGLSCVTSAGVVPQEAAVTRLIEYVSLTDSPEKWAEICIRKLVENRDRKAANAMVMKSHFNIKSEAKRMEKLFKDLADE